MAKKAEIPVLRPAAVLDAVNIVKLLKAALRDGSLPMGDSSTDKRALQHVMSFLCSDKPFVIVADISGRLVGVIACVPIQTQWGEGWIFQRTWFYVLPAYRDEVAPELMRLAESISDDKGIPFTLGMNDVEQKLYPSLLRQLGGYGETGKYYLRTPKKKAGKAA